MPLRKIKRLRFRHLGDGVWGKRDAYYGRTGHVEMDCYSYTKRLVFRPHGGGRRIYAERKDFSHGPWDTDPLPKLPPYRCEEPLWHYLWSMGMTPKEHSAYLDRLQTYWSNRLLRRMRLIK